MRVYICTKRLFAWSVIVTCCTEEWHQFCTWNNGSKMNEQLSTNYETNISKWFKLKINEDKTLNKNTASIERNDQVTRGRLCLWLNQLNKGNKQINVLQTDDHGFVNKYYKMHSWCNIETIKLWKFKYKKSDILNNLIGNLESFWRKRLMRRSRREL